MPFLDRPADGVPADSPAARVRPDDLVVALARFLRDLHRSEPAPAAGSATPTDYVARARREVEAGLVDRERFDPPYRPHEPARLVAIAADLAGRLGDDEPGAPVHGSLSLADLRLVDGAVVGWAVPEGPLVGDRYVDLSFLARDLATTIGPAAVPALFDAYGLDRPDPVRIEFWVTIRQLL